MKVLAGLLKGMAGEPSGLKYILENCPTGVIITDAGGLVRFLNPAQARLDKLNPDEVIGRPKDDIIIKTNITHPAPKNPEPVLGYVCCYRTYKGLEINASCWIYPIFKGHLFKGSICFTYPLQIDDPKPGHPPSRPVTWGDDGPAPSYPEIVGQNPSFTKAISAVRYNCNNSLPVLISGETGVGKEVLAKLVHQLSTRSGKPYLTINCAAIPSDLLEGLLFGTVKGSFTGAIDRPGLFEEANGGVLYLDEIDSMPIDLQPKLLRVLQEMRVSRVGSSNEIRLDLKIISSINTSPQTALGSGKIRPDLFYRLAVVMISISALRKRPDDLERLTRHFIQKYCTILGKKEMRLEEHLWGHMCRYHWPGNIRELEHMLAATIAMVKSGDIITLEHIPDHYAQAFSGYGPDEEANWPASELFQARAGSGYPGLEAGGLAGEPGLIESLSAEKEKMRQCLMRAGGNLSRAAEMMDMSRQTFSYRILKLGLNYKNYKPKRR